MTNPSHSHWLSGFRDKYHQHGVCTVLAAMVWENTMSVSIMILLRAANLKLLPLVQQWSSYHVACGYIPDTGMQSELGYGSVAELLPLYTNLKRQIILFVFMLYVPSQQLWSWRNGQFT